LQSDQLRRRDFITLLGDAADCMAGLVRAQLSTGGNVTAKRLSEAVSWVPRQPQRPRSAMARRWIGAGILNIE
jgi:hypothetical protein